MKNILTDIPWHLVFQTGYAVRRIGFTTNPEGHPEFTTEEDIDEVKEAFVKHHLNPGWLFSYHYEGEDENLRRAEFKGRKATEVLNNEPDWIDNIGYSPEDCHDVIEEIEADDYTKYQLHVRLFDEGDKTIIKPHHELDSLTWPKEHIKQINLNYELGLLLAGNILANEGIGFERTN